MGCLFGYCGKPESGLLARMAGLLSHRSARGWEHIRLEVADGLVVEIGHGIAPWCASSHVAAYSKEKLAMGYSGVLFNHEQLKRAARIDPSGAAGGMRSSALADGWENAFTAELLASMAPNPQETIAAMEGCFVAALSKGGELYLVRDPAGVKALYWTRNRERLVFASEIKALFADGLVQRRMRMGALPEYLTFSFIPGEGTMFEGIRELQPGNILTYREGCVSLRRNFVFEDCEWNGGSQIREGEFVDRVREDLEISVDECCQSNGHDPSVFLSGGIDSSAVLAVAARRQPDRPIRTFSVHFGTGYANENEFISMMVDKYATNHTWLEIRPKRFLNKMRQIIWYLDDPIGDPITVPNFLLAEAAAQEGTLVLNGEGGDPCYGGPKNIPMMLARLYGPLDDGANDAWLERDYLLSYRKCFTDLSRMLSPDLWKASGGEEALTAIITPFFRATRPASFLNKLMAINIRLKGANLILVKVDKMSSANGMLALPPLFSKRTIQTSMACPPQLKLIGNVEKGILKKAVDDIVPALIIRRPKSGMMVPVKFWFQGEMRRYAKKVLSKRNIKRVGLFDPAYAKKLLAYDRADISGSRHGLKLWMLTTFMLWYDLMIESPKIS